MKKFIDNNSKGPDVSFRAVNVVDVSLGRHVNRRSDAYVVK